jgi:hypothetical protein
MEKESKQKLDNARKKLSANLSRFVDASRKLLKPLKSLNDAQIAALFTLGYSMKIIMLVERPTTKIDKAIISRFKVIMDEICPSLGDIVISKDPCFESTLAYVSALGKCDKEGRSEDQCREAWQPGAESVNCAIRELENMRKQLKDIMDGIEPWEPWEPFPLP